MAEFGNYNHLFDSITHLLVTVDSQKPCALIYYTLVDSELPNTINIYAEKITLTLTHNTSHE